MEHGKDCGCCGTAACCSTVSRPCYLRDRKSPGVRFDRTCGQKPWHGQGPCHNTAAQPRAAGPHAGMIIPPAWPLTVASRPLPGDYSGAGRETVQYPSNRPPIGYPVESEAPHACIRRRLSAAYFDHRPAAGGVGCRRAGCRPQGHVCCCRSSPPTAATRIPARWRSRWPRSAPPGGPWRS